MIYRFVVCYLLGPFGLMLLPATALTYQMASFAPMREWANVFWHSSSVMRGPVLGGILLSPLFLSGVSFGPE
jgi:hypothetical protein